MNALIAAQWPFISEWFQTLMRESAEPLIRNLAPSGVKINFGDTISLGSKPIELQDVEFSTYVRDSLDTHDSFTNVRIIGRLDYQGDSEVDVEFTGGRLVLTSMGIKGTIIIELARLRTKPPWFSGLRVYFPDTPDIDIQVESRVLGVVRTNFGFIKKLLVKVLSALISRQVVLPNRFGAGLGDSIDTFNLKHPRPQGCLRLAVVEAKGLRGCTGSSWWRRKNIQGQTADPYVEAEVGAEKKRTATIKNSLNPRWGESGTYDFIVTDPDKQNLRLVVHDEDYGFLSWKQSDFLGRAEGLVSNIIARQRVDRRGLPEHWMSLKSEDMNAPRGRLQLRAQWRDFVDKEDEDDGTENTDGAQEQGLWFLGAPNSASLLLIVDVFYVSGLPPVDKGTPHWATIEVVGCRHPGCPAHPIVDSPNVKAFTPEQHGRNFVHRLNPPSEVKTIFEDDPLQYTRLWRKRVPVHPEADKVEKDGGNLLDAIWERPFYFLLDAVQESAKVIVRIHRLPKGGKTRSDGVLDVGMAVFPLTSLLKKSRWTSEEFLLLSNGMSQLKLRLQVRRLRSRPASMRDPALRRWSSHVGMVAEGLCTPCAAVAGKSSRWHNLRRTRANLFTRNKKPSSEASLEESPVHRRRRLQFWRRGSSPNRRPHSPTSLQQPADLVRQPSGEEGVSETDVDTGRALRSLKPAPRTQEVDATARRKRNWSLFRRSRSDDENKDLERPRNVEEHMDLVEAPIPVQDEYESCSSLGFRETNRLPTMSSGSPWTEPWTEDPDSSNCETPVGMQPMLQPPQSGKNRNRIFFWRKNASSNQFAASQGMADSTATASEGPAPGQPQWWRRLPGGKASKSRRDHATHPQDGPRDFHRG